MREREEQVALTIHGLDCRHTERDFRLFYACWSDLETGLPLWMGPDCRSRDEAEAVADAWLAKRGK